MALRILIIEDSPERQEVLCRLCKDHAWVLVHTARRAIALLGAYDFDLILLDYDLASTEKGDRVAAFLAQSSNQTVKVIVHAQNSPGAKKIQAILPLADHVPFSKLIKSNATTKRLREELSRGPQINWDYVFTGR